MDRIAEIKARCEVATPGAWYWHNGRILTEDERYLVMKPWYDDDEYTIETHIDQSNADFIAHAREDIPYLLEQLANRESEISCWKDAINELRERLAKCQQEAERLREAQLWIPVDVMLPESGKHVLLFCETRDNKDRYVCDGYHVANQTIFIDQEGRYLPEGFYEMIPKEWNNYGYADIFDIVTAVTHWMPLPEPPEGE